MRTRTTIVTTALSLALGGSVLTLGSHSAQAQEGTVRGVQSTAMTQSGQLAANDYNFLEKAARIDAEEVQVGKLAQEKGDSQAVRNFGERMIRDHSDNAAKLRSLASAKGATIPAEMAERENTTVQQLSGVSGPEFDRTFAQDMVQGHTDAIKEFQQAAESLSDPGVREYAKNTLPTLKEHLRMAKDMQSSVQNEK